MATRTRTRGTGPPETLPQALRAPLRGWSWIPARDAARLPAEPGAYLLLLRLARARRLSIGAAGERRLEPGWYLYAGSARGPGGLAARVGRHLRGPGRVRWHVDHLRQVMSARGAWVRPGGDSCAALAEIVSAGVGQTVPGIGASDCPNCASHVIRL